MLEFFSPLKLFAYPALTLELTPTRYRVADVAVFAGDFPADKKYPTDPVIAIEIVSEDDRHVEILEKPAEYHAWGVKHVCFREVAAFDLPEYNAKIAAAEFYTPQQ